MDKPKELEISFKPITDGLGFHPFSDGLPYAPIVKTTVPSSRPRIGSGAVAAGPSSFNTTQAFPKFPTGRVSVPIAKPITPPPTVAVPPPFHPPVYGLNYLLKRMIAYMIDSLVNITLCIGAFSGMLWKLNFSADDLLNPTFILLPALFLVVFNWALITSQEILFRTTLGKRIFGLGLSGGTAATFLRAFFFLPSVGFCGVGLLWALIDRNKRCWHDAVVDLQPIEMK